MARGTVKPTAYWDSEEGWRELFDRTLNVIKVGGYKPQFAVPDPAAFHRRMDMAAKMGRARGYDVMFCYGDGADSAAVRYFGGGYDTLFAEILFALGTNPDPADPKRSRAFPADFELGKMVRHYCEEYKLDVSVYQVTGLGLTGEVYENVKPTSLEDVIRTLAGKDRDITIAVITGPATNTQGFIEHMHATAKAIPGARVVMDNAIMPELMYNKDEEEVLAATRAHVVAAAMLDIGLACSSPNVRETTIAGFMEVGARALGALGYDWEVLIGGGKHNDATISKALTLPLEDRGPINIGGCPYFVAPVPIAPTERAFSWVGVDDIGEVPSHVVQAYNALLDGFFAVRDKMQEAAECEGPYPVKRIDEAQIDALRRTTVRYQDGSGVNMAKMRTYSSVHIMGARECGLQQNPDSSGDITFQARFNFPEGFGIWGHDSGGCGWGYKTTYVVCERTGISNKGVRNGTVLPPKTYRVLSKVPVDLSRIIAMTGTGERTAEMYRDPLRRS
jgi:hypothetical protein